MAGELFASTIGAKMLHVPHRGDSAAVTALLSGDVDIVIAPGTAILSHIEAGTFRALAISGNQRWPKLPEVATIAETVAPGYEVMAWMGVATAHGVPRAIVERLNTELRRAIAAPHVDKRLRDLGAFPVSSTPEAATIAPRPRSRAGTGSSTRRALRGSSAAQLTDIHPYWRA